MVGLSGDFGQPYGDGTLIKAISAPGDIDSGIVVTPPVVITQAQSVIYI